MKQQILIIGGGYAGCYTAKYLDDMYLKHSSLFKVTLVSPREGFLLHKMGAARAAAVGEAGWVDRVMVPMEHLFEKSQSGEILQGRVINVDEERKTCALEDGRVLRWDMLVVATGSRNFSPADPPIFVTSPQDTQTYFQRFKVELIRSQCVLVVGSGAVGIELLGELRHYGPAHLALHCVTRSAALLDGKSVQNHNVGFRKAGVVETEAKLRSLGIEIFFQDEVVGLDLPENGDAFVRTPQGVELRSGRHVACDLVVCELTIG